MNKTPKRLQLRRTKGWRKPPGAIVCTRSSKRWGNPFRIGDVLDVSVPPQIIFLTITRDLAVDLFRAWALERPEFCAAVRAELAGHDLACWCPLDQRCHVDVLLEIANPRIKITVYNQPSGELGGAGFFVAGPGSPGAGTLSPFAAARLYGEQERLALALLQSRRIGR